MIQLKNNGKSDYTIRNVDKFLTILDRNCNLDNPEEVKAFIANHKVSNNTKECYSYAYSKYCKHYKIKAKIPFWEPDAKQIKTPTNEKLEMLISASSPSLATKIIISKECGLRPVEMFNLKVKEVDLEQKILYPTTAKHGAPRAPKISQRLKEALQEHITRKNLGNEDKIFTGNATYYGKSYRRMRNILAKKNTRPNNKNNPTLRLPTLLRNKHIQKNKRHPIRKTANGTQKNRNNPNLHTTSKPQW